MYIRRLVIRNFRAIAHLDVGLKSGLTCIIGENNTGKTSILHAIRLALDGNLPNAFRQLTADDFTVGLDISIPQQIVIGIELAAFKDRVPEEALVADWVTDDDVASICFRFRPKETIRDAILAKERPGTGLTIDDYGWQLAATSGKDPATLSWKDDLGAVVRFDKLAAFHVAHLFALRDVEEDLRRTRISPLAQLLDAASLSDPDKAVLVEHVRAANDEIRKDKNIAKIGAAISSSFEKAVGKVFKMNVDIGVADPTFAALARSLRLLLTDKGLKQADPSRNGLGLNNVLYICMLLEAFRQQIQKPHVAGQLLLVEEPEAHLHPELQRVLFGRLLESQTQTIATTHSTHITSKAPLANVVVLTNGGTGSMSSVVPQDGCKLATAEVADLERYLDATRSTLLFARRVLLVEGMSEVFVIPPLVKRFLKFDLEEEGIAIVPIHGTHFGVYAKLFREAGIQKKCAIITDGDLKPRDGIADGDYLLDETVADGNGSLEALNALENPFLKVFWCTTTFELELASHTNMKMFAKAAAVLGAPKTSKYLLGLSKQAQPTSAEMQMGANRVLAAANRFGKARFAQVVSRHVDDAGEVPTYIAQAMEWLRA